MHKYQNYAHAFKIVHNWDFVVLSHNIFLKTITTIMIDSRQNTQIWNWDYLQLPLAIAFIFTVLIVHLIFYHFSNLHLNLSKW